MTEQEEERKIIGIYLCQNPDCPSTRVVYAGQLMTTTSPVHCDQPMTWQFPIQVQEETKTRFTPQRWQEIGTRLQALREERGMEYGQVAQALSEGSPPASYTATQVLFWEQGLPIPSPVLMKLAHEVFHCALSLLLRGPLPLSTPEEWSTAFLRGEISEGLLARGLGTTRLEARTREEQREEQKGERE